MKNFGRGDTMVSTDGDLSPNILACMSSQPKHLRKKSTMMMNPHRSSTFKRYFSLFNFLEQTWKQV
jgi:hypothetical protein